MVTLAQALTLADDAAVLVARPTSPVAHVYVGPLTRSRRYVPRAARPVCGTRTRRLQLLSNPPLLVAATRRACRHCSARLLAGCVTRDALPTPQGGDGPSITREALAASYADLNPFDIALGAFLAETVEEVQRLELLALLVVGYPACATAPVVSPAGKTSPPVDVHIARARTRVGAAHEGPITREDWAESATRSKRIAANERELTRQIRDREAAVFGHTGARDRARRPVRFVDARASG